MVELEEGRFLGAGLVMFMALFKKNRKNVSRRFISVVNIVIKDCECTFVFL